MKSSLAILGLVAVVCWTFLAVNSVPAQTIPGIYKPAPLPVAEHAILKKEPCIESARACYSQCRMSRTKENKRERG